MSTNPRVHTYRVEHDVGLAPNPFHRICTLAVCKPEIRRKARGGDLIIGMSSAEKKKPRSNPRAPVFVMRVAERLHFDDYWLDERFRDKRPITTSASVWQAGDNIYRQVDGEWQQAPSWHRRRDGSVSPANLRTDTRRSQHVLIGGDFAYWGTEGPDLPPSLLDKVKHGRGENMIEDSDDVASFMAWADPHLTLGRVGWPLQWSHRGRPMQRMAKAIAREAA